MPPLSQIQRFASTDTCCFTVDDAVLVDIESQEGKNLVYPCRINFEPTDI